MADFIPETPVTDVLEATVSVSSIEESVIVAASAGDSDDDSLGLTELADSMREVAEMEGMYNTFMLVYKRRHIQTCLLTYICICIHTYIYIYIYIYIY